MLRVSKFVMALFLLACAAWVRWSPEFMASAQANDHAREKSSQNATLKPAAATSPDIPLSDYDPQAEQVLLDLANQARAQAGLRALTPDPDLVQAARAHAREMAAAHQLSHQFDGELPLPQRLADTTRALLDQEGENVALDYDANSGHKHLMQSPPHRANLLNPSYNVIGLGVIRSGERLYIVQDFGHALPNYSAAEVKEQIAGAVAQTRRHFKQPELTHSDLAITDKAACSMAQADKLGTAPIHQLSLRYTVLAYTSLHPETLPLNAEHALASRNLRAFSVGTCYSRTQNYPTGAYWVVLAIE
jgi:uncharacterized protein YkwD